MFLILRVRINGGYVLFNLAVNGSTQRDEESISNANGFDIGCFYSRERVQILSI